MRDDGDVVRRIELGPRKWKTVQAKLWPWWKSAAGNWWTVKENRIAVVMEHKWQKGVWVYRVGTMNQNAENEKDAVAMEWQGDRRSYETETGARAAALEHLGLPGASRALRGAPEDQQVRVSEDAPPPERGKYVRRIEL